jgi:hypothetical protein
LGQLAECDFDLGRLCRLRNQVTRQNDLSTLRVDKSIGGFIWDQPAAKDNRNAWIVADEGVEIFTAPQFKPCNQPPPMRRIYITVAAAVNKIIYDMCKAGAVLILPTRVVRTLSGVHFSPMHWIKKKDKECGRIIGDVSNDENHNALNDEDEYVANTAKDRWGDITHPTIDKFALMILEQADVHGWDNVQLWKMDLKGAFSLLRVKEDDVCKLAFELT